MKKYDYSNNSNGAGGGVGIGTVLFLIFLVLKLCNVINWSWWWVTAPLWGSVALYLLVLGIALLSIWIQELHHKRQIKKWRKKRIEERSKNNG